MSDFDAVKQRADIVDVVQQYVPLQRAGRAFKACCPFHQERTPSFYVFPDRQTWRCFGACGTGGDVFTFLEKKENLTPLEALRLLAERYGVPLSRPSRERDEEPERARLLEANEEAARFYHDLLLNAAAAEPARRYLERRGLDDATIRAFQLGYAPEAWQVLSDHLRGRGFTDAELLAAGLVAQGERGLHDRFRGRVMFPIADERGRVIGFGGRVLGDGVPKYLNTPQTALFDKGGTLYALDRAKDAIRATGAAVVVEGYMDAIAAHQHGITNVVATLGTALTERHIAVLKRYARQVVLAMDADAAGVEAALRGEELVRAAADEDAPVQVVVDWRSLVRVQAAAPLEVRVFTVPQGKDPDEAIRADPAAFRELTRQAIPPFEFRLQHELRRLNRTDPRARVALADRLLPLVAAVADRALQAQYLARLAQVTAIPEPLLADRLRSLARGGGSSGLPVGRPLRLRERAARAGAPGPEPAEGAEAPGEGGWAQAGRRVEAACLRLLLTYRALRPLGLTLEEELFHEPAHRALFAAWRTTEGDVQDVLPEPLHDQVARILAERLPPYDEAMARRALEDVIARLRLRHLEDRTRLLATAVAEAESDADPAAAAALALAALSGASTSGEDNTAALAERLVQHVDLATQLHMLEAALRGSRATDRAGGTGQTS